MRKLNNRDRAAAVALWRRGVRTIVALAIMLASVALAGPVEAQQFERLLLSRGNGSEGGKGIAVDAAGNRYVVGRFSGQAKFGDGASAVTLNSRGQTDGFVAKYGSGDTLIWVREMGSVLTDEAFAVAVGPDGSVYVTGYFHATANFSNPAGQRSLKSRGVADIFIVKYSAEGRIEWLLGAGSTTTDTGIAIAVDGQGQIIVTGAFASEAVFADINSPTAATLRSAGANDIYLVAYDTDGRLRWARRAGGSGTDGGRGLTISGGDIFLTGGFSGTANFESPGGGVSLTSVGGEDLLVARYSREGELRWARGAGGPKSDRGLAIAVDQQQRSYVTGFFSEAATFGDSSFQGFDKEIVVVRFSPNGTIQRASQGGSIGSDEGRGIAVAPDGSVHITGRYQALATFGEGANMLELPPHLLSFVENYMFVAAYTADLVPTFVQGGGDETAHDQAGQAITVDASGRSHVTGEVFFRAIFGSLDERTSISTKGLSDMFVATYEPSPPSPPTRQILYISSSTGGTVDGIPFADEDVLAFDPISGDWSMLVDGSDIGLGGTDLTGFEWLADGTLLMSFETPITLPGIPGTVDDSDVVRFIPERLGATTAGRFEPFFDGSVVGLSSDEEEIDVIATEPEPSGADLMLSTLGDGKGLFSNGQDSFFLAEDLLLHSGSRGATTSGSLFTRVPGTVAGLGDGATENLSAAWHHPRAFMYIFAAGGPFAVKGGVSGDGADLVRCDMIHVSRETTCVNRLFFDGSANGFGGEIIDAFSVGGAGVLGDIGGGPDELDPPE